MVVYVKATALYVSFLLSLFTYLLIILAFKDKHSTDTVIDKSYISNCLSQLCFFSFSPFPSHRLSFSVETFVL